jgi:hypothetical protein
MPPLANAPGAGGGAGGDGGDGGGGGGGLAAGGGAGSSGHATFAWKSITAVALKKVHGVNWFRQCCCAVIKVSALDCGIGVFVPSRHCSGVSFVSHELLTHLVSRSALWNDNVIALSSHPAGPQ